MHTEWYVPYQLIHYFFYQITHYALVISVQKARALFVNTRALVVNAQIVLLCIIF